MRCVLLVVCLLIVAGPAAAQSEVPPCAPTPGGMVEVETTEGTLAGTLFCLGATDVSILRDGQRQVLPLAQVKRIRKQADPIWDGALKGVAIPLTIWGVSCGFCGDAAPFAWRSALGYALIGAAFDGLQTNRKTIYVSPQRQSVGVRIGF
jgi:hypothetical protein